MCSTTVPNRQLSVLSMASFVHLIEHTSIDHSLFKVVDINHCLDAIFNCDTKKQREQLQNMCKLNGSINALYMTISSHHYYNLAARFSSFCYLTFSAFKVI